MKKILGFLFGSLTAIAADRIDYGKYYEGRNPDSVNYIKNSSCFTGVTNITGTNTTPSKNTTTPLTSISDCQSTLDSATDTVDLATNTLDRSLKNGNCEVAIRYKLTLGSGNTVQLQARINSATVASANLVTSDNGTATVNFPCGDLSNAPSLRIAQTAGSSSQAINWSNAYLGAARNIGTVAQAQFMGKIAWAATTNCEWTTSSGSYAAFAADSDCPTPSVTGSLTAPGTKIPAFVISNAAPGTYQIFAVGRFANNGTNTNWGFRFHDGTNAISPSWNSNAASAVTIGNGMNLIGTVTYATAGSRTIELQGFTAASTAAINAIVEGFEISVYRFPSSSEIAVRNGQSPVASTLKYAGTASCIWGSITSGSQTAFSADTDCPTPSVTGSASAPGTKIPGVTFSSLPAGQYLVTAQANLYAASTSDQCMFELYDGTNSTGFASLFSNSGVINAGSTLAGVFTYAANQSSLTIQIRAARTSGSGTGCQIQNSNSLESLQFSVIPLGQNQNAPILVGSVTSNSTGAERSERASLTVSGSACTIASQSGSWLSSCTWNSTGNVTLNFASGMFSGTPTCECTAVMNSGVAGYDCGESSATAVSTSSVRYETYNVSSLASADANLRIRCQGPR